MPTSDGGSSITGYTVEVVPAGQPRGSSTTLTTGPDTLFVQLSSGITAGSGYEVYVTAQNAVGTSPPASPTFVADAPVGLRGGVVIRGMCGGGCWWMVWMGSVFVGLGPRCCQVREVARPGCMPVAHKKSLCTAFNGWYSWYNVALH